MTTDCLIAYISDDCATVTDWQGKDIGTCRLHTGWYVKSYIGSRMYQADALIDGKLYTGRTFGAGMSIKLRARRTA
jgi:hypothetical protein